MQDKFELVKKIGQTLEDCGLDTKGMKVLLIYLVFCNLEAPKDEERFQLFLRKQYD